MVGSGSGNPSSDLCQHVCHGGISDGTAMAPVGEGDRHRTDEICGRWMFNRRSLLLDVDDAGQVLIVVEPQPSHILRPSRRLEVVKVSLNFGLPRAIVGTSTPPPVESRRAGASESL